MYSSHPDKDEPQKATAPAPPALSPRRILRAVSLGVGIWTTLYFISAVVLFDRPRASSYPYPTPPVFAPEPELAEGSAAVEDEASVAPPPVFEPEPEFAWDFEGSAAVEDEAGVARCIDVQVASAASDRTPEEGRAYSTQFGREMVSAFADGSPIDDPCVQAYPSARPYGVCVTHTLLESVELRTTLRYYRRHEDDSFVDPPEVRCENQGGTWTASR